MQTHIANKELKSKRKNNFCKSAQPKSPKNNSKKKRNIKNSNNHMKYLFLKLLTSIKVKLISFFKLYSTEYYARKTILLANLLEKRHNCAKLIQEYFKLFLLRKDLYSLAKKHKDYFSVYPTFLPKKKFEKISIKIFTDLSNPKKYTILPVRFCLLRNCYVFDIPKNKFPENKKLMRFIFLIDNNKEIIDKKYKKVLFGNDYVNEIDFKKIYLKELRLAFTQNNSKTSSSLSDMEDEEEKPDKTITRNIYKKKEKVNRINYHKNKNKNENDLTNSTMSTKGSPNRFNEGKVLKRKKSILKGRSPFRIKRIGRKVSFGFVKFSY